MKVVQTVMVNLSFSIMIEKITVEAIADMNQIIHISLWLRHDGWSMYNSLILTSS